jgi:hypothetical protein
MLIYIGIENGAEIFPHREPVPDTSRPCWEVDSKATAAASVREESGKKEQLI